MATVQHQEPRQQISQTDLEVRPEPEPRKEKDWLSCKYYLQIPLIFQCWFSVKASLLENPGRSQLLNYTTEYLLMGCNTEPMQCNSQTMSRELSELSSL